MSRASHTTADQDGICRRECIDIFYFYPDDITLVDKLWFRIAPK